MAKVGTAHVEIKPVLNEDELKRICDVIEESIAAAIRRSMKIRWEPPAGGFNPDPPIDAQVFNGLCTCQGTMNPHPFHSGPFQPRSSTPKA